jgi:hypothetical protein
MVLAGDKLAMASPPDVMPADDPEKRVPNCPDRAGLLIGEGAFL